MEQTLAIDPREQLRRARSSEAAARATRERAEAIERHIAAGVNVVPEERGTLPGAVATHERTVAEVEKWTAIVREIEAEQERERAAAEAAEAKARRVAIEQADKALLAARREQDRAMAARLDAAQGKDDGEYAKAVEAHLAAQKVVFSAHAARESLEDSE